ncbi:hypothetical protein C4D60_Mb09t02620 [Musa balbisiana]|uniref:Uncharacterized protein n=1 Tax=Musa balbisiana TaxID=52838 RepID=A0A4S8IDJ0_MUSBA|nr:hypothetical protein C4D60_Mb09t02620 [Musa balbisiana]
MDVGDDGEASLEVGTTGTIGSLMTRELESMKHSEQASSSARRRQQTESMKHSEQASSSARRRQQTGPVFVPCGAAPGKASRRRNQADGCGSGIGQGHSADAQKRRHSTRKNDHRVPILGSGDSPMARNSGTDKVEKKGHGYTVEVVDLKCSNPMSNRLKKLSFSKLSESIS